jgi:hypothetical protein
VRNYLFSEQVLQYGNNMYHMTVRCHSLKIKGGEPHEQDG